RGPRHCVRELPSHAPPVAGYVIWTPCAEAPVYGNVATAVMTSHLPRGAASGARVNGKVRPTRALRLACKPPLGTPPAWFVQAHYFTILTTHGIVTVSKLF